MTQECYQQSICNPEPFVGWKQLETIYVKPNIFQEKLSQKKTELLCGAITRFNFECRKISRIEWPKETNGYLITHVRMNKLVQTKEHSKERSTVRRKVRPATRCMYIKDERMNERGKNEGRKKEVGSVGLCRHNFEHNAISGASSIMLA